MDVADKPKGSNAVISTERKKRIWGSAEVKRQLGEHYNAFIYDGNSIDGAKLRGRPNSGMESSPC